MTGCNTHVLPPGCWFEWSRSPNKSPKVSSSYIRDQHCWWTTSKPHTPRSASPISIITTQRHWGNCGYHPCQQRGRRVGLCCASPPFSLHSRLTALTVILASRNCLRSVHVQLYPSININRPELEWKTYVFGKTLVLAHLRFLCFLFFYFYRRCSAFIYVNYSLAQ